MPGEEKRIDPADGGGGMGDTAGRAVERLAQEVVVQPPHDTLITPACADLFILVGINSHCRTGRAPERTAVLRASPRKRCAPAKRANVSETEPRRRGY